MYLLSSLPWCGLTLMHILQYHSFPGFLIFIQHQKTDKLTAVTMASQSRKMSATLVFALQPPLIIKQHPHEARPQWKLKVVTHGQV